MQARWTNFEELKINEYEKIILDYDSKELKNFHLLNQLDIPADNNEDNMEDDTNIASLQKRVNEALDKEQYEIANELQKKIDKLLKK